VEFLNPLYLGSEGSRRRSTRMTSDLELDVMQDDVDSPVRRMSNDAHSNGRSMSSDCISNTNFINSHGQSYDDDESVETNDEDGENTERKEVIQNEDDFSECDHRRCGIMCEHVVITTADIEFEARIPSSRNNDKMASQSSHDATRKQSQNSLTGNANDSGIESASTSLSRSTQPSFIDCLTTI